MKYSCLALLATLVGTVSVLNNNIVAEAAPISRILASHSASAPAPAFAHSLSGESHTKSHVHRRHMRHNHPRPKRSFSKRAKQPSELDYLLSTLPHDIVPIPAAASEYLPRTRSPNDGHVVLDPQDDDAGNELLDTEADRLALD
ncbi:hypothetical protein B0O80DRAFT_448305, partial [Mortierella sp. GBAus27b]